MGVCTANRVYIFYNNMFFKIFFKIKFELYLKLKQVILFDDTGAKKDKFPTKPSDAGQKSYVVRSIEFSPDSTRVAVA